METKLVIAAGAFYLDSDGRVRGPMLEGSSDQGPFFSENANGFPGWDGAGIPLQGSQWKDGPRLVEECFVVKHPQDDMPIIPLDNDRKGYMIELLTDYTSDEFEFEDEVVYVISQSNVFRYMERLNRFLPMDRPQEFMEYMKRNGNESVHMLLASIRHIDEELAKVDALKTREAFLQISDSARDFVAAMRDLNDGVKEMGTRAHLKIKHIREQMAKAEAEKIDEEITAKFNAAYAAPGDKIDYLEVPVNPHIDEFAEELMREIAKTMGLSYEEVVKDYELITGQDSYTKARALELGRMHRLDRRNGLGSVFVAKIESNPGTDDDILRALAHKGGPIPHLFPATKLHFMKVSDMPKWDADHPRVWSERWQRWMPAWKDRLMNSREETGPRPKVRADGQRMRLVLKNLGVNNVKAIGGGMIDAMFLNYSKEVIPSVYWNELEQSFNDVLTDDPKGFEFARIWMPVKHMFADDRLDVYPRPGVGHLFRHRNGNIYEVTGFNNEEHGRQEEYPTRVEYRNALTGKKYSRSLVDWWRSMKRITLGDMTRQERKRWDRRNTYLGHRPEFGTTLESESLDEPFDLMRKRDPNWYEATISFHSDPENKRVIGVLAKPFGDIPAGTVMERNEDGTVQPAKTEPPKAVFVAPKVRLTFPNLVDPKQERPRATKFAAKLTLDTRDPTSKSFMQDLQKTAIEKTFAAREHMLAERASKEIAERILKGLLVTGFENDRDIEKVLDDQRPLVENSIKRTLLEGDWKKVHAPHD